MVCSFIWNVPPHGNTKTAEAVATQYIKAKYGVALAEFARRIIAKRDSQEGATPTEAEQFSEKDAIARPPPKHLALRQQFQARYNSYVSKFQRRVWIK